MTVKVRTSETVEGDVLAYLMETALAYHADDVDEAFMSQCKAVTVRDNGELMLAAAYLIHDRPHGRELEVIGINGSKAKCVKWLPQLKAFFVSLGEETGCNRILVSVSRPAMQRALEALDFGPVSTLMRFMI